MAAVGHAGSDASTEPAIRNNIAVAGGVARRKVRNEGSEESGGKRGYSEGKLIRWKRVGATKVVPGGRTVAWQQLGRPIESHKRSWRRVGYRARSWRSGEEEREKR